MLRKLTFLACIVFVGNLNADRVPIPVPQAIQNAYAVSDIKHGHFDDPRGRYWVVDNGVLYAMNTNLYARTQPPLVNNVVRNGTLLPYHARVADHIFGIPKGKKIKQGELFYLSNIAAEENGLVFTFESWNLYPESFVTADGTAINSERSARMKIRFAMTPAQIATLTPEAMKQMTEKFFTVSSTSVHAPIITPDYEW
jgi:hypothetical protein